MWAHARSITHKGKPKHVVAAAFLGRTNAFKYTHTYAHVICTCIHENKIKCWDIVVQWSITLNTLSANIWQY